MLSASCFQTTDLGNPDVKLCHSIYVKQQRGIEPFIWFSTATQWYKVHSILRIIETGFQKTRIFHAIYHRK